MLDLAVSVILLTSTLTVRDTLALYNEGILRMIECRVPAKLSSSSGDSSNHAPGIWFRSPLKGTVCIRVSSSGSRTILVFVAF